MLVIPQLQAIDQARVPYLMLEMEALGQDLDCEAELGQREFAKRTCSSLPGSGSDDTPLPCCSQAHFGPSSLHSVSCWYHPLKITIVDGICLPLLD